MANGRTGKSLAGLAMVVVPALLVQVHAARDPDRPLRLDADSRARIVQETAALVTDNYVYPEPAEKMAAELRSALHDGAYDGLFVPADLAAALTRQLEVYDRHFRVGWSAPSEVEPVDADPHSDETGASWREWSRLQNFGFRRVEVLPGNVGYLDLRYFEDTAGAGDTATAAMALLAHADAVIVDVRHNGGGEPSSSRITMR